MATLKQADRLMQFSSSLGKDVLLIESLDGVEGISRLFEFNVELLATLGTPIEPKAIIGSKVAVAITLNDADGSRWVNGIVASFEQCAGDSEFNVYKARIVPSMWQLNLNANCRVFQNKTVLDIAKAVFGEYGLSVSDQTSETYKPVDYCTQYSETDFHFVTRILEESGIFYWFEHTDQDNKIMLGDSRNAYQDCPLSAKIPYVRIDKGSEGSYASMVTEFTSTATMVSGKHATADYNFRTFARVDIPDKNSSSTYGKNGFEQYLYPAGEEGYLKDSDTQLSTDFETLFLSARALASDSLAEILRGEGDARSFCAGYTFSLTGHPRDDWNRKYLLTAVSHSAVQVPSYRTSDTRPGTGYSNRFSAVSSDIVFKPEKTAEKPKIYGPQTAFVVAPAGEEMYIDKFGRVCVQFFWDKLRRPDIVDNTWVRVAQGWAGNGWGSYFWPRLKDEVVVQFLNGDPDNPLVVGSVYNGVNMPKYPLPDNSTRSGLYTRSSKGGSGANANELRFEDKKDSEQIFIHAEKDMDESIEHDRRISVGNNDSLIVTNNQTEQIGADFNREIKGNSVEKIGSNADINIGSNLTEQVGGNHSLNISSNEAVQVGSAYSLNANQTIYINGGMSVVIQAGMQLSLVASGNFITIGPAGVAISGTMVLINSGGAAGSGSAGQISSPKSPAAPDKAEDATSFSNQQATSPTQSSAPPPITSPTMPSPPPSPVPAALGAATGAVSEAEQAAQQVANQITQQAQQAANQAQQAVQQAENAANQAVNYLTQQAQGLYQQANKAVQQAEQAVQQATAQGRAAAQQALNQAQQQMQQCAQAGQQAIQQAQQEAQQVKNQVQQTAAQAQQQAQQAEQQAQQAVKQGEQAAQQAEQQAQQALAQAQNAAKQAQAQAKQAAAQVTNAASQAKSQATAAAQGAQQSATQAMNQAKRGF